MIVFALTQFYLQSIRLCYSKCSFYGGQRNKQLSRDRRYTLNNYTLHFETLSVSNRYLFMFAHFFVFSCLRIYQVSFARSYSHNRIPFCSTTFITKNNSISLLFIESLIVFTSSIEHICVKNNSSEVFFGVHTNEVEIRMIVWAFRARPLIVYNVRFRKWKKRRKSMFEKSEHVQKFYHRWCSQINRLKFKH